MNGFKYTDADFITKDAGFEAHEYNFAAGRASLGMSAVKAELFSEKVLSEKTAEGYGFKLDPFLLNEKKNITGGSKELAVIVPSYNNGKYLYGRCFRSLLRSSIFDKMQIYIIDDGSTDRETEKIIKDLCRRYDNVTAYFFSDGGSGSASRPRNKGLEMAQEPYVTYLDPDNEAAGDGYAKLYRAMLTHNTDFVFGTVFRISQTLKELVYHFRDQLISSPGKLLVQNSFLPHSIQACLFRRTFLTENEITNPVGALGQDSLFFQTAMLAADSAYYINSPVHMYYAERSDSEVNTVTPDFFRKFLLLETEQVKQYKKYKIYEEYIKNRLDYFIINWYLEKYSNVRPEEKEECADIIEEILTLYGKKLTDYKGYF